MPHSILPAADLGSPASKRPWPSRQPSSGSLQTRVSATKEPSRYSSFSRSSGSRPTQLLAYRYPDAASGPLSGRKQVVVVHK
jgi:hypothetical protein